MLWFAAFAPHGEEHAPMIADPLVFAGVAAAIFIVLGLVTWSFRDVANRHGDKVHSSSDQSSHH